jgi:hypothetical protein
MVVAKFAKMVFLDFEIRKGWPLSGCAGCGGLESFGSS